jgi:TPP-dependent pyruvate/acetoin dehydrogenase alpha subunit
MKIRKQQTAPAEEAFSLISNQKLISLYAAMLDCRAIDRSPSASHKNGGKNGTDSSILGHEAAAVGAVVDLLSGDTVAIDQWPDSVLKKINPLVSITSDISFASRAVVATKESRSLAILFSSGKRSWQGRWKNALNLAVAKNLPMIFVSLKGHQNSIATIDTQVIPRMPEGYALPSINVDGNDVVAVYRVVAEAIAHARKDHGPTLIQCMAGDAADPLQNMEKYLARKGLISKDLNGVQASR